ncbi:hypothetical protein PsYK624_101440 [Phanerochaete sordida]|uniref:Uncharacterized protein n=1 Tax=Phanerochaete sordida TaxID=48140 RepID=A0A9P3GFM1_9APHY|nr:hypothetical protein PsYK624_101440 [Phanerochaete sordida]
MQSLRTRAFADHHSRRLECGGRPGATSAHAQRAGPEFWKILWELEVRRSLAQSGSSPVCAR